MGMSMMMSFAGPAAAGAGSISAPSAGNPGGQATTQGFGMGTTITTTNQDEAAVALYESMGFDRHERRGPDTISYYYEIDLP